MEDAAEPVEALQRSLVKREWKKSGTWWPSLVVLWMPPPTAYRTPLV